MVYLQLLFSFFKIGLFSFGGGYAMIPLIQKEIESHGWLTSSEFIDIVAIAEMTPGPIAVNSATFVGYKAAGILGSMVATMGVALPSLILILLISKLFFKFQKHPINVMIFYGVRPVVTALIAVAALLFAETALLRNADTIHSIGNFLSDPLKFIDFGGIAIFLAVLIALIKFKVHPILTIAGSGVAGIIIYYVIPMI